MKDIFWNVELNWMAFAESWRSILKIVTFTYNDLGISYGPSIHYLELWNSVSEQYPEVEIYGCSPSWTGSAPIIRAKFPLRQYRVWWPIVRQVLWDLKVAGIMLAESIKSRRTVFYVRVSSFHIFSAIVLKIIPNNLAIEMNGYSVADAKSRNSSILYTYIAKLGEGMQIKRSNITFSVTPELVRFCKLKNPNGHHVLVPNGVAVSKFSTSQSRSKDRENSNGPITCVYVGTFTAWDGAKKISDLARSFPEIDFLMVGDGVARTEVEACAPDNVTFIGWVNYNDLSKIYHSADVAIALYESERHNHTGISSLKIREYIANQLPIFSTNVPGNEIINDYGIGMVSNGDFIIDFATFSKNINIYNKSYISNMDNLKKIISWDIASRITADSIIKIISRS